MRPRRMLAILHLAGLAAVWFSAPSLAADTEAPKPQVVLDTYSYWRAFAVFRPVALGATTAETKVPDGSPRTPLPPADWTSADFDDAAWMRQAGPVNGGAGWVRRDGGSQNFALVCLRGKFSVADPAKVEQLLLSLAYRGGFVAWLNGREVARGHVGKSEGAEPALADEYPWDAYVGADGKSGIPYAGTLTEGDQKHLELRVRRAANIALPTDALRKGVNVLALALHRAPVHPDSVKLRDAWKMEWSTLGLNHVALAALPDGAARPNLVRPTGIQVWSVSPMDAIFDADYGDPNEPLRPIRIVGARRGTLSGQVVVSSTAPIKGLAVEAGELKQADGKAAIPASAVVLRYPLPTGAGAESSGRYRGVWNAARFDGLADSPPAEAPVRHQNVSRQYTGIRPVSGAVQPIRVSVEAPADAAAGDYSGVLTVRAEGLAPVAVPVQLTVCGWTLPEAKEYVSHTGIVQSPESVALFYKAPLWSEKHWELVGQSMKLLGRAGTNAVFLPLIARHHFGKEGMVRWTKNADGTYGHDYTIFDKYLALALEHMGKPQVACLYAWEPNYAADSRYNRDPKNETKQTAPVNVLDPKTGEVSEMPSPFYGAPECADFWKPVLEECRARLKKAGVSDAAIMIGMASDRHPAKVEVEMFQKAAPWATWVKQAHGLVGSFYGVQVGHVAHVWGTQRVSDPRVKRVYGWKRTPLVTVFPRAGAAPATLRHGTLLSECWTLQEAMLMANFRGVARIGADFWTVTKENRHYGGGTLAGLYANWGQTTISESTLELLYPAPGGPASTVRLDTLHQGIQEAEARIFIEKALTDAAARAKLGDELAARCQNVLDDRALIYIAYREGPEWYPASGWQERSRAMYEVAGEVARALGAK